MKYVLVLLVVLFAVWWAWSRRAPPKSPPKPPAKPPLEPREPAQGSRDQPVEAAAPQAMLACAHCGVHLPKDEAVFDLGGQPYCGAPHRLAGPS